MIPKVIHYCWFGGKKMPPLLEKCITTWKENLVGYDFILWNEDNFISDSKFYNYALENKKWAFVSDYVRLKTLYDQGGIYLDTDMFFVKPFDEEILSKSCFFGVESDEIISCGVIGAIQNHFFIKKCINHYDEIVVLDNTAFQTPITKIITNCFRKEFDYKLNYIDNLNLETIFIYKYDYFYPYPYNINKSLDKNFVDYATNNTYAIHLWCGSWQQLSELHHFRRREYFSGLKKMIINIIKNKSSSKEYYKKVFISIKKSIRN